MSTDEVDASGATAKSSLPPPPSYKPVELRDINPNDIEWREATKHPIDVLLIVVNDKEFRAAYEILGKPVASDSGQKLGRVYFGEIQNNKVALLRSSQGAGGKIGMQATCLGAIEALRPKAIICLGVCFGMDKRKHKLGDVLVSTKLGTYGPCRMSNDGSEESRGVVTECDERLSRLFNDGKVGWESPCNDVLQPTIHCGLVVSGPQLIDNNDRKKALKDRYPEAIGGEMEGEGLYNICELSKIPWIVCKAVSDWADGTKNKKWQPFSAAVSASLVQHVLTKNYIPESEHAYKNRDKRDEVDAGGKPQKGQQPPCRLQVYELAKISRRIPRIWRELALETKRFEAYEIDNIDYSRPGQDETSKALTMLTRYDERGGTRKELADALKEVGQDDLSKKVLSGKYNYICETANLKID